MKRILKISGSTGAGKTQLLMQAAYKCYRSGSKNVFIGSTDMPEEDLLNQLFWAEGVSTKPNDHIFARLHRRLFLKSLEGEYKFVIRQVRDIGDLHKKVMHLNGRPKYDCIYLDGVEWLLPQKYDPKSHEPRVGERALMLKKISNWADTFVYTEQLYSKMGDEL
jgi:RecA/RadA recombinase